MRTRSPIGKGDPIPNRRLARLVAGRVEVVEMEYFVAGAKAAIVGVPGAFAPVCSNEHMPAFISTAPQLRAAGFARIICVAVNDPWVMDEWARKIDPDGQIVFLSDGNLEFTRAIGMQWRDPRNFMGERSRRYLITCDDGIIKSFKVEAAVDLVHHTKADVVLIEA